jgi:hypothetical protein
MHTRRSTKGCHGRGGSQANVPAAGGEIVVGTTIERGSIMGRHDRTTRRAEQRLPWLQRHTLSTEAEQIMDQQADLRAEIRGITRLI